jgi:hypothetical protein
MYHLELTAKSYELDYKHLVWLFKQKEVEILFRNHMRLLRSLHFTSTRSVSNETVNVNGDRHPID